MAVCLLTLFSGLHFVHQCVHKGNFTFLSLNMPIILDLKKMDNSSLMELSLNCHVYCHFLSTGVIKLILRLVVWPLVFGFLNLYPILERPTSHD